MQDGLGERLARLFPPMIREEVCMGQQRVDAWLQLFVGRAGGERMFVAGESGQYQFPESEEAMNREAKRGASGIVVKVGGVLCRAS